MPAWILSMGGYLVKLVGTNVGRWVVAALGFLGLQFVTQEFAVEPLLDMVRSSLSGLGADAVAWLAYLNVDRYITIVFSAYATAAAMNALKLKKAVT